ncbi:collagen alpha-2(XI) chain [Centropristis striata]|uniref:collagen alpha-2(XI) chain n=1 Tax=Centropristis striata TaxID=184440 RepID=UPI0027E0FAA1|nr:collagen alpha-2(XI) chain [Centropristis striata]
MKDFWVDQDLEDDLGKTQGLSGLDGLLGVEGNEGDPGDNGFIGAPGKPGRPGKMGKPGSPGIRGNTGTPGFKGKAGRKGKQGPPGPTGPKGLPGLRGEKGESAVTGPKGNPGLQGLKGRKGHKGKRGSVGQKGMKGVEGRRGPKGVKGKRGPPQPRSVSRRWSEVEETEESFSWPQGTKDDPATSCYELGLIHPHLNDGYFYMDPNQGCPYDAVKVFCNFTAGGTTCIEPLQSQIKLCWESEKKTSVQWFSQQPNGSKFEYPGLDVVQLRFLRLHSHTSFQRMTIGCTANQSSTAETPNSANRMFHVLGDSGNEIISHLAIVSKKGCEVEVVVMVRGSTELHRGDMELLPVRDLGVEIKSLCPIIPEVTVVLGPLCFL